MKYDAAHLGGALQQPPGQLMVQGALSEWQRASRNTKGRVQLCACASATSPAACSLPELDDVCSWHWPCFQESTPAHEQDWCTHQS